MSIVCSLTWQWLGGAVGQAWANPAALHPVDRLPCHCSSCMQGDGDFVFCELDVVKRGGHGVGMAQGLRTVLDSPGAVGYAAWWLQVLF